MTLASGNREFRVEPLERHHERTAFACGNDSLDRYLKTQATQDVRRKANAVFVMTTPDAPASIVGYFTLCAFALDQGAVPEEARKHIPRYPLVSATLIGRLAVDMRMPRSSGVDAIDERAARFYRAHGFIRLVDSMRLILPMATLAELVKAG
jgi:hypothetical protein